MQFPEDCFEVHAVDIDFQLGKTWNLNKSVVLSEDSRETLRMTGFLSYRKEKMCQKSLTMLIFGTDVGIMS